MTALLCVIGATGSAWSRNVAVDDHFYTYYSIKDKGKIVAYYVCGQYGCGAAGQFVNFRRACAVMEGTPITKKNVVTRALYVFDKGKTTTDPAMLDVYTKTDTISADGISDTVQVTLQAQVSLGFTAGSKAHCAMAADDSFVFVGTNISEAVTVDKNALSVNPTGMGNVASITADDRGYVTISSTEGNYEIYYTNGGPLQSGGGGPFEMANAHNAFTSN